MRHARSAEGQVGLEEPSGRGANGRFRAFDGTTLRPPRRPTGTGRTGTGMLLGRGEEASQTQNRLGPPRGPVTDVACDKRQENGGVAFSL